MCCTRLAEKKQDAKIRQKNRHLRTIARLCQARYIFATKAYRSIDNRKNAN